MRNSIYCRGHQKGDSDVIEEDRTAKTAAKTNPPIQETLIPEAPSPKYIPSYTLEEATWAKQKPHSQPIGMVYRKGAIIPPGSPTMEG